MVTRGMKTCVAVFAVALTAQAKTSFEKGAWSVSYEEKDATLTLTCPKRSVSLTGKLSFVSENRQWTVAEPRDAARDRLSLVSGGNGDDTGFTAFGGGQNIINGTDHKCSPFINITKLTKYATLIIYPFAEIVNGKTE